MSELTYVVESLDEKVNRLIQINQKTLEENRRLKVKNEELEASLTGQKENIRHLQERLNIDGLSKMAVVDDGARKQLRSRIQELIRDVDKCISLLNR